jgi:hypothetical protein
MMLDVRPRRTTERFGSVILAGLFADDRSWQPGSTRGLRDRRYRPSRSAAGQPIRLYDWPERPAPVRGGQGSFTRNEGVRGCSTIVSKARLYALRVIPCASRRPNSQRCDVCLLSGVERETP